MSLVVTVDSTDLEREIGRVATLDDRAATQGKARVRQVSLEVVRAIKQRTPIDTGRARNSWGVDIWEVINDGWGIVQGSKVVYFQRLNEGHSKQAPAGFVDTEAEKGLDTLANYLANDWAGLL